MSLHEKAEEFHRLIEERERHRGHILTKELERLATSYYIVMKNYEELVESIRTIESDPLILSPARYREFRKVMREIARLLHNYVASVKSLIDHTCRFRDKYGDPKFLEECEEKLKELTGHACAEFVKLLRNYVQHVELPIVGAEVRFHRENVDEEMKVDPVRFRLDKERLLRWDRWNVKARNFITAHEGDIEIVQVFKEYNTLNGEYNKWFHRRIREFYKKDLDELVELSQKIQALGKEIGLIK